MTGSLAAVRERALALGFDAVGIAPARLDRETARRLREFVHQGLHGDMGWLADTAERRSDPHRLWRDARSVVMVAANYGPERDPLAGLGHRDRGVISVYARNRDYHQVLKGRLKNLAGFLQSRLGGVVKVFVDTAPVMEKPLAEAAGLGWQGKNTMLVSRQFGSWLFLGALFTDRDLAPDTPEADHCGQCTACLEICPTRAFPAPYRIDARRCISYLTIEHKGHIDRALRPHMGNRIFGCDDCLAVCPWNKFARPTGEQAFRGRDDLTAPELAELSGLDDPAFRARFAGTAIRRTGRARFVRNVLIAIGNSDRPDLVPAALARLEDDSPLVRAAAVWALSRLDRGVFRRQRAVRIAAEPDAAVREEWRAS